MKKRTVIIGIAVLLLCGICAAILIIPRAPAQGNGKAAGITDGGDVSAILSANRELLLTYVDTPSNFAITLLGLDGIVSDIKKSAQDGALLTDECAALVEKAPDACAEYSKTLSDFNSRFLQCNERTLEVKKNRDVAELEGALTDVLSALLEYNELLKDFKAETGG